MEKDKAPLDEIRKKNRKRFEEEMAKRLKEIPLELRLEVLYDMAVQSFLIDIGFIPNGYWSDEKEKKYGKTFHDFAKKLTKFTIKEVKKWEKDGKPN